MSGFSQFLGAVAGQVATRLILNKVASRGLGQREPGGYVLPVIIPGGVDVDRQPGEDAAPPGRFRVPNWLFFTGYGALLWYAAKATDPVVDMPDLPDLGDPEPEADDLLFPGLKRELTHLDVQDAATSDDPVEACLERAGWKLDRVDKLRQRIFEKDQVDIWEEPKELTRSEGELLQAIETCLQRLESQYGSLEAAGVSCSICGDDNPDLAAVQREMFDPEQMEMDLPKAYRETGGIGVHWFYIVKGRRKANYVTIEEKNRNLDFYYTAEREGRGKLYFVPAENKVEATKRLHDQLEKAKEYSKKWGGKRNPYEPFYFAVATGKGYRRLPVSDLAAVQREMFDPEQMEIDFDTDSTKIPQLYEYLDSLKPGEPANILDACNSILRVDNCTAEQIDSVIDVIKQEGYFYIDDLREAYKLGDKASIPEHRKTRYLETASRQPPKEKAPEDMTSEEAEDERSVLNKKAIENLKKAAAISPGLKYDVPKPGRTLSHDIATHYLTRDEMNRYKLLTRVISVSYMSGIPANNEKSAAWI